MFFLQMFCILLACRVVGALARRLGQPQVVGEMVAGVFLGPSLLGLAFPGIQQALFPAESLKVLYVGAQLGVGLYMFLVGVEFDLSTFRERARSATSISIAGMAAPFLLGAGLTLWLVKVPGLFSPKATLFEAGALPGSGPVDHGLPDAGADHLRTRAHRFTARHAGSGRRGHWGRGCVVRDGGRAGEFWCRRGHRHQSHRRRHSLRRWLC